MDDIPGGFRLEEHPTNLNELNTAVNQKVLDLPKVRELVESGQYLTLL